MKTSNTVKTWARTSVQNLVRHKSGRYYARVHSNGKETWKLLKTDLIEVAKVKLREVAGAVDRVAKAGTAQDRGRMTMADCAVVLEQRLVDGYGVGGRGRSLRRVTAGTSLYRRETLKTLWKTWPELEKVDVRKVSERAVEDWARRFAADYSGTRTNGTMDTLRGLLRIAIDAGWLGLRLESVGR